MKQWQGGGAGIGSWICLWKLGGATKREWRNDADKLIWQSEGEGVLDRDMFQTGNKE